jgi:Zn-dependent protease
MENMSAVLFGIAQSLPGFLLAIVAHEAAHAWMANRFGDATAKAEGRLTLNPAAHYDMWGTILFPLISAVSGWAIIGWAKPVPINTRNFRKLRPGIFWVSFAGPLANLVLGTLSAFLIAFIATQVSPSFEYFSIVLGMLKYSVFINFILAFFNLIPIPPLDGSKMVSVFLKGRALFRYEAIAAYSPAIFMGVLLLSMVGIHTLGYVLMPAQHIGQWLIQVFFLMLSGV